MLKNPSNPLRILANHPAAPTATTRLPQQCKTGLQIRRLQSRPVTRIK
jgi:hypothetical protein